MNTLLSRRSALVAAALAVASLPMLPSILTSARAEEPAKESYVVLGDSISTGYGLDEKAEEASFATLLAEEYEYALELLAKDGLTAVALAEQLEDPEVLASIADASLITITIGGNDFMQALYTYLANTFAAAGVPGAPTAEDVAKALQTGDTSILSAALEAVPGFATSEETVGTLLQFNTCLPKVLEAIKTANPEAKVIVATQYNPYSHLGSAAAALGLDGLATAFEDGLTVLNQAIVAACTQFGCEVADVYTQFQKAEKNPCNATVAFTGANLDFHPNAYGHSLIAKVFSAVILGVDPDELMEDEAASDADAPKADASKTAAAPAATTNVKSIAAGVAASAGDAAEKSAK